MLLEYAMKNGAFHLKNDNVWQCSKKIVIEAKWCTNDRKSQIDGKEYDTVCLMGLEGNRPIWTASTRQND